VCSRRQQPTASCYMLDEMPRMIHLEEESNELEEATEAEDEDKEH
jgi:hypothetical protein